MYRHTLPLLLLAAATLTACGRPGLTAVSGANLAGYTALKAARASVVTAKSVEALGGNVLKVTPLVLNPPGSAALLSPASCLGNNGPLGAYGPLGLLGPIGSNAWNASAWLDLVGNWEGWSKQLTQKGGPLSAKGPLGPDGSLGDAYSTVMPKISDFSAHLAAGGLWTALGPVGPLGALGPLGPLGPMGAHGFKRNGRGTYLNDQGQVQRTIEVPYEKGARRYELFERYPGDTAAQMTDNDTSFMAEGAIDDAQEVDRYAMTSRDAQYVTAVVVPEAALDDFDLELRDAKGQVIGRSDSRGLIDFVQARVGAGEKLEARVTRHAHGHVLRATYRLIVTGSTRYIPVSAIKGPHVLVRG